METLIAPPTDRRVRHVLASAQPLRLHLGCGRCHIPGYVHIDVKPAPHVAIAADLHDLSFIEDACADLIYASHVLEHFGRWEYQAVLAEWGRILRPGGTLRLAVPDFEVCARLYYEKRLAHGLADLVGLITGGQRDAYDHHCMVFDELTLREALTTIGFENVRRWDWRETEHAAIDDYSQAFLPHMDKDGGTLVSLNIEADRPSK